MREFHDTQGQRWQAAPMYASYGQMLLVFSRMDGHDILQKQMFADTLPQAEDELAQLDEAALRQWLAEAQPWDFNAKKF
ncbi:hypothetical protein [Comamonas sp. NLF-1-9]|uniref:hypothetical protein n=1 Tax=Comamonas sp. NLF-1-9 TaxID=2853163 RepID=UPI001C48BF6F|nr:hypothetical protein [Comamonas sp. NLF-1-9]QXL85592.1 hypothetical protein KUD94_06460 [Comamonas sp. NLF-1-9]